MESHQQALAITREVGNRAWEAATLNNIGLVYRATGHNTGRRAKLRNLTTDESWTIVTGSDYLNFDFSADGQWALVFSTIRA